MKWTLILLLILTALLGVGCGGDKDKSSNSGSFSNGLSTREGYFNLMTESLEVNGQTYQLDQYSRPIVTQAYQMAQMQRIQPININGMMKYRARITAQLNNYQNYNNNTGINGHNPQYPQQYPPQYYPGNNTSQLMVSGVQFY